jgi:hypothetical protein
MNSRRHSWGIQLRFDERILKYPEHYMKRFFMWILCWFLYGCGHLTSILSLRFASFAPMYPAYNRLMQESAMISDTYGFKVWREPG